MLTSAFDFQVDGIYYNITSTTDHTVEVASGSSRYLGDIVIPDHVTYNGVDFLVNGLQKGKCVGAYGGYTSLKFEGGAFTSSGITSIVIPSTITEIGDATFAHCSSLRSITFPNNLTKITGRGAFYGTSSLSEVTLPDALTEIGYEVFWGSGITSLTIGPNIKKGGYNAFKYCSHLEVINIPSIAAWCQIDFEEGSYMSHPFEYVKELRINGEKVTDIVIDSSIPKIGTMCFYKYEGLKSIKFEAGIKSIGNYAFWGCSGLEELDFPDELNTIGNYAFEGCSSIKKIKFSKTINYIGTSAFKDCSQIELIETSIMKPMETSAFNNNTYMFTPLYVPKGTSNLYKNTSGWSSFSTIIEKEELGVYKYKLTYMVDNMEYKSYMLDYGTAITPEPAPTKEGYTFSGWSEIPETMPANDVTITGSFTVNSYKLTYMVDNMEYKSFVIDYGTAITPEPAPTKEGYTFSGWSDIPTTMPAHDVIITGSFTKNTKDKCANPTIKYENGKLYMECATDGVTYVTNIGVADAKQYYDATIQLSATYNISVYATKEGYDNSETVTATLCWIDAVPKTEGITDGVAEVRARAVLINSYGGLLTVEGINDGQIVDVYSLNGEKHGSAIGKNGAARIDTNVPPGSVVVVKIGNKSVKVIVK